MRFFDWVKRRLRITETSRGYQDRKEAGSTPSGELERAINLHSSGDLDNAEKHYKELLTHEPDLVPALHLLGRLCGQKGKPAEAAAYLARATAAAPNDSNILSDLARITSIQGKPEDAIALFRKAITCSPNDADLHFALAQTLAQSGNPEQAAEPYNHAIRLRPEFAEAYNDLGALYSESGNLEAAKRHLIRATELDPGLASARLNLAQLHMLANEVDHAEVRYREVLARDPVNTQALEPLASLYELTGRNDLAVGCLKALVGINSQDARIWRRLGDLAQKTGQIAEAVAWYGQSLQHEPDQPETLTNLGASYGRSGKFEQAAACLESAVALRPDLDRAYHNLGSVYHSQGRLEDAISAYEEALRLSPDSHVTISNLISISHFQRDNDPTRMSDLYDRYLCSVAPERIKALILPDWERSPLRRLRVGYVSPDFKYHSVSFFLSPAISGYDRAAYEVFCYSDVRVPDSKTEFFKTNTDHWRDIHEMDHDSVAELVRRDRIDVLVDLDGHYADNRLPVFAERPAPVQIAYLGYPSTTGLPEIGFRLTDAVADPAGDTEQHYTETLVRFPQVFLCYEPPGEPLEVINTPAKPGTIRFGSFNELSKISADVVRVWATILTQVPDSTLMLKSKSFADEGTKRRVAGWFSDAGVDAARLLLLPRTATLQEHLALYAQVDIALDTFPYNGTTTTCEALFKGVPVIALLGGTHVSRVSASLLSAIGVDSLIAQSEGEYIYKATSLASDTATLSRLHETLRDRMLGSPLMDKVRFVRALENIYREAWKDWCDEHPSPTVARDAVDFETMPSISGAVGIRTRDSNIFWLPEKLNHLAAFALCSLEDWYEEELKFVRLYLAKGMKVLDVGAYFGMYSLVAAQITGNTGRVWSVEPATEASRWLGATVRFNQYDNIKILKAALTDSNGKARLRLYPDPVDNRLTSGNSQQEAGELVDVLRLDRAVIDEGISEIDFVRLGTESAAARILDGGRRFFTEEAPLVMFEVRPGSKSTSSLLEKFRGIGYSIFRLAPGPGLLVPAGEPGQLDAGTGNLFACGEQRAHELFESGCLLTAGSTNPSCQPVDEAAVWRFFESQAYSQRQLSRWRSNVDALSLTNRQTLFHVFGLYVSARAPGTSAAEAYYSLIAAYDASASTELSELRPEMNLTRARLAGELGYKAEAINMLSELTGSGDLANSEAKLPFLSASPQFDSLSPGTRTGAWIEACALDAYLRTLPYSVECMNETQYLHLERLHQTGFERPEMERRRLLLSARLGRDTAVPSQRLLRASDDNLNPEFWREFRPQLTSRSDSA